MAEGFTPVGLPPAVAAPESRMLVDWVTRELESVRKEFEDTKALELRTRHAAPEKPRAGMLVYADGTDWDPGSGEGLYVYTEAGAWEVVGGGNITNLEGGVANSNYGGVVINPIDGGDST